MLVFKTHDGQEVTGDRLTEALNQVADEVVALARDIYRDDPYASHVPETVKLQNLEDDLNLAARIRAGKIDSLTTRQQVNTILTGECIALLP